MDQVMKKCLLSQFLFPFLQSGCLIALFGGGGRGGGEGEGGDGCSLGLRRRYSNFHLGHRAGGVEGGGGGEGKMRSGNLVENQGVENFLLVAFH